MLVLCGLWTCVVLCTHMSKFIFTEQSFEDRVVLGKCEKILSR